MNDTLEIRVPDIGDFRDVEVIEVLVAVGDTVQPEDPLITLESDKATMDVPSPAAGVVEELLVAVGDRVSEGSPILRLRPLAAEAHASAPAADAAAAGGQQAAAAGPPPAPPAGGGERVALVVLGAGPGGYTAAFRAADLGLETVLIERYPTLGGVCLNVGCIPSKALLHAARVTAEAREMADAGIRFAPPEIDLPALARWKNERVVGQLTRGLAQLAKQRGVRVVQGVARFSGDHTLAVDTAGGTETIAFERAIIAAGSRPATIPNLPDDPRVWDSTDALKLESVPRRLLVIGGGIIGLEMATVYHALGSEVSVVELTDTLMPGTDRDLVKPLESRLRKDYAAVMTRVGVSAVQATDAGLTVSFSGDGAPEPQRYDAVLVAVGRVPNGHAIAAEAAGVAVDERGFIAVDDQQRTNMPHIFAIGDITGQPMLAHKATHEGKVAAEVAAGRKSGFDARVIPSVAYTDPEVAWVGLTETQARAEGRTVGKGAFPWAASGRALSLGRAEGLTKLLFDEQTGRLIGGGIVGVNAGDLIAEVALAIEMGANAEDIGLTVHPHPTLSETVAMAAEVFEGTVTDLYIPRKQAGGRKGTA